MRGGRSGESIKSAFRVSQFRPNVGAVHPVMRMQSNYLHAALVVGVNRMHRRDASREKGTAGWLLSRQVPRRSYRASSVHLLSVFGASCYRASSVHLPSVLGARCYRASSVHLLSVLGARCYRASSVHLLSVLGARCHRAMVTWKVNGLKVEFV